MEVIGNAKIDAALICSRGGRKGPDRNFVGNALTNCPVVEDPLIARPKPTVGGCTYSNREVNGIATTLSPGVYCGGLSIRAGSEVTFAPDIYIIKDGVLNVEPGTTVYGREVGF